MGTTKAGRAQIVTGEPAWEISKDVLLAVVVALVLASALVEVRKVGALACVGWRFGLMTACACVHAAAGMDRSPALMSLLI